MPQGSLLRRDPDRTTDVAREVLGVTVQPPRTSDLARRLALVLVAVGVAIRVVHFVSRRSLWLDEAMLANNVVEQGWLDLAGELRYNQAAPPGFLWLEKLAITAFGNNEYALRVVPLLAGVTLLFVVWSLTNRLFGRVPAWVATVYLALSPTMIRFSTEVKQYALDALVVALVLVVGARAIELPTAARRIYLLAVVVAIAPWVSYLSVLSMAAIGIVLLPRVLSARPSGETWSRYALAAGLAGASLCALYLANIRHVRRNDFLHDFWREGFPPGGILDGSFVRWCFSAASSVSADPGRLHPGWLGALVVAVGAVVGVRFGRSPAAALVPLTLAAGFAAAIADLYPLKDRVAIWIVPVLALALGATALIPRRAWAGVIPTLVLLLPNVETVVDVARNPPVFVEGRQAYEYVLEHWKPGDQLIVHDMGGPVLRYYSDALQGVGPTGRSRWLPRSVCNEGAAPPATELTEGRVWVLFAYTLSTRPADEADRVEARLAGDRKPLRQFRAEDARATLYASLRTDPVAPAPGALACLQVHGLGGRWSGRY